VLAKSARFFTRYATPRMNNPARRRKNADHRFCGERRPRPRPLLRMIQRSNLFYVFARQPLFFSLSAWTKRPEWTSIEIAFFFSLWAHYMPESGAASRPLMVCRITEIDGPCPALSFLFFLVPRLPRCSGVSDCKSPASHPCDGVGIRRHRANKTGHFKGRGRQTLA